MKTIITGDESWVYRYDTVSNLFHHFLYNDNLTRAINTTSLKCCLPSTDTIDRWEKIHTCVWRFKVASCNSTFNQFFWFSFKIIVAIQLHVYTASARSKLHSYCSHCKRAGSEEGELTYSKDRWVSKLLQGKIILHSNVSLHCHSIVATIKKPAHVFCLMKWYTIYLYI